jgi:tetratricopeptide (TPR) repeat protein
MTEEGLFEQARQASPAERIALLARECAGNPALRLRLEARLEADARPNRTVDAPAQGTGEYRTSFDQAGAVIAGRYTLVEPVGEGGMGEVWVARQSEPVKRKVALKLIKAGMDTKAVLQRFEAERQALALMDHPNIAKVLDGGMTTERRPFFAMELVNGLPLTRFCDEARLGIRERLELFVTVCQAVQHAHQKGVIHRDLKPSNILVTVLDGKPVPKVIDFGVAKAIGGRLTEESLATQFGAVVGTFEYMSPEQAGYAAGDVDTRTDVYSLGVILYELLTGLKPLDSDRLKQAVVTEMIRIIREEEPSKPSTRLSTDASAPSLAASRHTEAKKLAALLRGELDWVVMRCLEKQRDRRYETASALARDVQRYLADEPIEARPPSAAYRLHKFVRRHRVAVWAGMLVGLSLMVGLAGTGVGFLWALRERNRANEEAVRALAAEGDANRRAAELADVADFQAAQLSMVRPALMGERLRERVLAESVRALERAAPAEAERAAAMAGVTNTLAAVDFTNLARNALCENVLDPALATVDERFSGQPLVKARLCHSLGRTLLDLGLPEASAKPTRGALEIRRRELGPEHPDTLTSQALLGMVLIQQGRHEEAEACLKEALAGRQRVLGADAPGTIYTLSGLANLYYRQDRLDEAEAAGREAVERGRRALGLENLETVTAIDQLALVLRRRGKNAEAEPLAREAVAIARRIHGDAHRDTLTAVSNLGLLLLWQNRHEEAEHFLKEALEGRRRTLGEDDPDTLQACFLLGSLMRITGRADDATRYLEAALAGQERTLGEENPQTINTRIQLAVVKLEGGQLDLAEQLFRQVLDVCRRSQGGASRDTLMAQGYLATVLSRRGRPAEAEALLRAVLENRRKSLGGDHPDTLTSVFKLGDALLEQGRRAEAEPLLREAAAGRRRVLPAEHLDRLQSEAKLGALLFARGELGEAEPLLREAAAGFARKAGKDHWRTGDARLVLGRVRTGLGRFAEAERELVEAERVLSSARLVPPGRYKECVEALVALYESWDKAEPGQGRGADAAAWKVKLELLKSPMRPIPDGNEH